ncbi:CapA family protein [Anaerosalibacter bizertensis]|uniref:CapA family protein n=1 Tax=Anaerosalibacter bizertensis TaxID=932217 RepID=A0A844FEA8_9FIRM|nr:CapA family protein [Anaerosalibacter bizertensis]MBV1819494.1 CapA family protein [Bacteroidales bacterium MSK.15.36]HHV27560.1 CapA family protein [Tissierellia bacterium]MBU5293898.1 CapA family protein [Anaerosalibacter bizertensis]MCB5560197.1 CapA family protein [Anaerosalibacter bizertensis]MCG4565845.1 CapA family protein [Anaerosalibacter bizertensis]
MEKKTLRIIFFTTLICTSILLTSCVKLKAKPKDSEDVNESTKSKLVETKPNATATILAAGDVMFHSPQIRGAYDETTGTYDFKENFKYIKKYVDSADLALANFETTTAGEERGFQGYPNFNSPEESIEALKDSGFDILSTANNHTLDQGKDGLLKTIDTIKKYDLKNVGTYKEPEQHILIEKVNDIDIGILSYTYGCNGMEHTLTDEELKYMVNIIDEDKIKNDIYKIKEKGADLVIMFIHWGNEYEMEPNEEQIELGKKMTEWGVDIVFGSHPHVIQKSEIIQSNGEDKFIIYSLGNFLSNQRRESINNKYTEDGVMVNIEVEKDFSNNKTIIKNVEYIPTWVNKYIESGKPKYEILPVEDFIDTEVFNQETLLKMKESYKNTMNKMGQQQ